MAKIIGDATDYIIKKGIANGIGNEAVTKLLKEGKLHGEWLDEYAKKLSKSYKQKPADILMEALDFALEQSGGETRGIGFKPQSSRSDKSIEALIKDIKEKLTMESKFYNAICDSYFTAGN